MLVPLVTQVMLVLMVLLDPAERVVLLVLLELLVTQETPALMVLLDPVVMLVQRVMLAR